ncbi:hypothetical protein HR12_25715 [Microbacterium sp. SUBG005]|nr:hypothetical protein HR12_25715 [Microbacterium sp. SUBG005]
MQRLEQARFMAGIGINADCLPSDDNTLVLSDETDEFGIPRARVSFTAGENEKAIDKHATAFMLRVMEAAGARETMVLARTAHTIGTCRMSTDPSDGVVDATAARTRSPTCGSATTPSSRQRSPRTPR